MGAQIDRSTRPTINVANANVSPLATPHLLSTHGDAKARTPKQIAGDAASAAATGPDNPRSGSTGGMLDDAVLRFRPSKVAPPRRGIEIERRTGCWVGAASNVYARMPEMVRPPSIHRTVPVTYLAAGEVRKATAAATSDGSQNRPAGMRSSRCCR